MRCFRGANAGFQPRLPGIDVGDAIVHEEADDLRGESSENITQQTDIRIFHLRKVVPQFPDRIVMDYIHDPLQREQHFSVFRKIVDEFSHQPDQLRLLRNGVFAFIQGSADLFHDVEPGGELFP